LHYLAFNRWRAAFFTPALLRQRLNFISQRAKAAEDAKAKVISDRIEQKAALEKAKVDKAAEKIRKSEEKEEARKRKEEEKQEKQSLGVIRKVQRKQAVFTECSFCCVPYAEPGEDEMETWNRCEHCDGRWWCADTNCQKNRDDHMAFCRARRQMDQAAHDKAQGQGRDAAGATTRSSRR